MSTKSKLQLQQELNELQEKKNGLMQAKSADPSKFTDKQQQELYAVTEQIIDLEEQIELASDDPEPKSESGYKPEPGTETLVHLSIIRGRRFDENTGKEVSAPYVQKFTYGEYKNFIKNAPLIGYTVVEELYNPYKEK